MKGAGYYDDLYRKMIAHQDSEGWRWITERADAVAPFVKSEDVLDLGCGFAVIADRIDAAYMGIDWSRVAIEWNEQNVQNNSAIFVKEDILAWAKASRWMWWGDVLLLDVIEHFDRPTLLIKHTLPLARNRLIVTVPRDMPGRAHIHPRWNEKGLQNLLGSDIECIPFGGGKWMMAVKDL